MEGAEVLGIIAGFCTTCGIVPQIIRVFKLKSAREISLLFTLLTLTGVTCWAIYGICFELPSVIAWNVVMAVLVATLLYTKLKYGR